MAFINIGTGDDLVLEIPVKRTVDWADKLREDCFQRIVEHDHSGSGRGRPLAGQGIADNGIDDRKILLRNNEWLRSAGQQGDPDQDILRINPSGDLEIAPQKLVMSNGVVINNNGADSSRVEGELTISDDLHLESNLLGPNLIQTAQDGLVSTKNMHLDPSDSDPVGPMDGQLQYSDGVHRAAGLWQYMSNVWVQIKRNFISEPINDLEIKLQNDGWLKSRNSTNDADINIVRVNALDEIEFGGSVTAVPGINSVGTPELQDGAVTKSKLADSILSVYSYTGSQSKIISPGVDVDLTFSDVDNDILNITSNIITFKKQGYYRVVLNLGYSMSAGNNFTNPTNFVITALGTMDSTIRSAARVAAVTTGGNSFSFPTTSSIDIVTSTINTTLNYLFRATWTPGIATHNTSNFRPILTITYLGI